MSRTSIEIGNQAARGPEGVLSDDECRLFSQLIYEECGVHIGPEKRLFLMSRLKRRMDELGMRSAFEYYGLLRHPTGRSQELPALLDSLMICETSFFRNQAQFELLRDRILPEVLASKAKTGSKVIRLWSAGCSTGQEPYSVVMLLQEAMKEGPSMSVRMFASDLSFTALERAQCGVYRGDQLKGVSELYARKYFRQENGHYVVAEGVKRAVIFDYHNLKNDNGLRGLDIIFCRNVMIYFDQEQQRRLVERFVKALVPGGFLFLGHAESLQGLSNRFSMLHHNKGIAYRLEG